MGARLGDHSSRGTILYAVSSPPGRTSRYEWGEVRFMGGSSDDLIFACAHKGRLKVLVGFRSNQRPFWKAGWIPFENKCFEGMNFVITVSDLEDGIHEELSSFIGEWPGSDKEFWVIYLGPKTDGRDRISGPWG